MALLYRFTRINDRANTGVFTFIVTRSVTRDLHRDATTKEFSFGYHRWVVSFNRSDAKMLGVHLILRNASANTRCYVDFAFSLINREHFSKNETYGEKQCRFNADQPAQGPSRWVLVSELQTRKFSDENGEFLMDLTISNPLTVFETDVRVSHFPFATSHHKTGTIETPYLLFGGFEWNVAVYPQGVPEQQESSHRPTVLLNRLTGFDHPVHVQYRIVLGDGDRIADSGILDQISDVTGGIRGFNLRCTLSDVLRRGILRVYVELFSANPLSEVSVVVGKEPSSNTPNCYDREKQAWCVDADLESECLKLKLFCTDLHHVPRNHLKYVSWNAYVLRDQTASCVGQGTKDNCFCALNGPHSNYYIQDGIDMGIVMETNVPVSLVDEMASMKADTNAKSLFVQIEWLDSLLLFSATYHKYDDVYRLQCHQMKREITALQAENYSLERQLFSYQKSISVVNSRGQTSEDNLLDEEEEGTDPTVFDRRTLSSEGQSFSETEYT